MSRYEYKGRERGGGSRERGGFSRGARSGRGRGGFRDHDRRGLVDAGQTARDRYFFHNSLLCLVKALEGKTTMIDLRNETFVTGKITMVDGYMNLNLEDAVFCDSRGGEYAFERFFVSARTIRYVHVPQEMPMMNLIKEQLSPSDAGTSRREHSPKPNFKEKRTMARHLETVSRIGKYDEDSKS